MMGAMRDDMSRKRVRLGFTLMETLLVMAVIAVIAAIAIPSHKKARNTARERQAAADLEIITTAVEQLAWDTGRWPPGILRNDQYVGGGNEVWDLTADSVGLMGTDGSFPNWKGPYIRSIPLDPWGNPYFFDGDYEVDSSWHAVVGSFGANGNGRNVYDSDNCYVIVADH